MNFRLARLAGGEAWPGLRRAGSVAVPDPPSRLRQSRKVIRIHGLREPGSFSGGKSGVVPFSYAGTARNVCSVLKTRDLKGLRPLSPPFPTSPFPSVPFPHGKAACRVVIAVVLGPRKLPVRRYN
jgi:hypothetical protein